MNKKKENGENTARITIGFIGMCCLGGFFGILFGILSKVSEYSEVGNQLGTAIKETLLFAAPIAFIVTSLLTIILSLVTYKKCARMHQALMQDDSDDDLWDQLEDELNIPLIITSTFTYINIGMFLCVLYESLVLKYDANGGIQFVIYFVGLITFFIASVVEVVIPQKVIDIEKKLNPEKKGNVLDVKFRDVWMESCDEAQKIMAYKAGFKAYTTINFICGILEILTFASAILFQTGMLAVVVVCIIWVINILAYSLEAKKLEKR